MSYNQPSCRIRHSLRIQMMISVYSIQLQIVKNIR